MYKENWPIHNPEPLLSAKEMTPNSSRKQNLVEIAVLNLPLTEDRHQLYHRAQDEDELCYSIIYIMYI